jgi:hypothetical protein
MYRAASGIQQEPAKRGPRANEVEVTSRDSIKFKIFFPTQKTVQQSRGGAGYPSRPQSFSPDHTNNFVIVAEGPSVYNPVIGIIQPFPNR